jgi:hypothetical protein
MIHLDRVTRKADRRKVKIALGLRQETAMTLVLIAMRLRMGTRTHLSHVLYWRSGNKS